MTFKRLNQTGGWILMCLFVCVYIYKSFLRVGDLSKIILSQYQILTGNIILTVIPFQFWASIQNLMIMSHQMKHFFLSPFRLFAEPAWHLSFLPFIKLQFCFWGIQWRPPILWPEHWVLVAGMYCRKVPKRGVPEEGTIPAEPWIRGNEYLS